LVYRLWLLAVDIRQEYGVRESTEGNSRVGAQYKEIVVLLQEKRGRGIWN